jgi:hypothetical protein
MSPIILVVLYLILTYVNESRLQIKTVVYEVLFIQ